MHPGGSIFAWLGQADADGIEVVPPHGVAAVIAMISLVITTFDV